MPDTQTIDLEFVGESDWSLDLFAPSDTYAEFDGVGGWSADLVFPDIYAEFDGEGGWSLVFAPSIYDVIEDGLQFDGEGGWNFTANYVDTDVQVEFDGIGGWSMFVAPSIYFAMDVAWLGLGAWALDATLPHTQLLWRSAGAQFIILDATSGVAYNSALTADQPATLLFNIGQPIPQDYTAFLVTITRPDGSSYALADPNLFQIGGQPWISLGWVPTPYFRTGYYLAYSFTQNELRQPGLWTVTYRGPANTVSMAFIVPPLARAA